MASSFLDKTNESLCGPFSITKTLIRDRTVTNKEVNNDNNIKKKLYPIKTMINSKGFSLINNTHIYCHLQKQLSTNDSLL